MKYDCDTCARTDCPMQTQANYYQLSGIYGAGYHCGMRIEKVKRSHPRIEAKRRELLQILAYLLVVFAAIAWACKKHGLDDCRNRPAGNGITILTDDSGWSVHVTNTIQEIK